MPHKDGLALNDGEQLRALVDAGSDLFRLEGEPTHRVLVKRAGGHRRTRSRQRSLARH